MGIRILAFNTTSELCSVALMVDRKIYHDSVIAVRSHSKKILFMINKLLIDAGVLLKTLDCIVFDQGPGSFVGVRIGINIAQGLALGANLPLIAVSSLNVLAQGAWRVFSSKQVITVIDARMNELYWAHYSYITSGNNGFFWICKKQACIVTTDIAQKLISTLQGHWSLVGSGWSSNSKLQSYIHDNSNVIIFKKTMFPEAQDMLSIAIFNWQNKILLTPDQIKPFYLCMNLAKKSHITK